MERRDQPGKPGKRRSGRTPAGDAALCGLMCALAFLFGYVEMLVPVSLGVPGVKLGLANLVSIVSLYLLGTRRTVLISLVRVILTGFTFGSLSVMMYSMAGAVLSLIAMIFCRNHRDQYRGGRLPQYRTADRGGACARIREPVLLPSGASLRGHGLRRVHRAFGRDGGEAPFPGDSRLPDLTNIL